MSGRPAKRRLALPHAPALAAGLNHHGDARAHVVLLHEVGKPRDVVERERGHVVQLGRAARLLDIGDDGHRVRGGQLVRDVGIVGVLRLEVPARGLVGLLLGATQRLARIVVGRRHGTARELREVGAQRPAAARALGEHGGHAGVRIVARAHDLDGGQPALAVPLHHHHVVAGHAAHDVGALRFALHRFDARHLPRSGNHRLARAGGAMAVRVLAGVVDVEAHMAVVLHAAHIVAALHQRSDELLDERRFT